MKIPEIYCLNHVCITCVCIRIKKTEKVVLYLIIYMYILKEIVYLASTLKTKASKTQLLNDFTSKSISINETAGVKIAPKGKKKKKVSASCKYVPQELTKW